MRPFQETSTEVKHIEADKSSGRPRSIASVRLGLNPQQPLQVAIASKISSLVSMELFGMLSFSIFAFVFSCLYEVGMC